MKKLREEKKHEEKKEQDEKIRLQEEYTTLGGEWMEEAPFESGDYGKEIENLEQYRYFDPQRIAGSVHMSRKTALEGKKLQEEGKMGKAEVVSGYSNSYSERIGHMETTGKENREEFPVRIFFTREGINHMECGCRRCRADYYYRKNLDNITCPYKAGAVLMLKQFLENHNIGDATDYDGQYLLSAYEKKRKNAGFTGNIERNGALRLVPRLERKDGKLSLSFKVGENRLFVIKKLDTFCENVKNSATDIYGSSTEINHGIDNFSEEGKNWISLIRRIVAEEKEFLQRQQTSASYYGSVKESIGGKLNLFGWRLDEVYEMLGEREIDFEDKDSSAKTKMSLRCRESDPKIRVRISEDGRLKDGIFHGIAVSANMPELYRGADTAYFISEGKLNRVSKNFAEKTEPLENLVMNGRLFFCVGRNRMSEFYYKLLPVLEEIADVTETNSVKFRHYLLPEPRFTFYLDAGEGEASCRVHVNYGSKEFSALDMLGIRRESLELFRDRGRENEVLHQAMQWFPEADTEKGELRCGDEKRIYSLMKTGTERLMELGEVRCTKRFLGKREVKKVKVSVGVSLSSDLLELDISTEDISQAELLDILKSYRKKQSYYRLKDGSFADLEEPSLEMLAELTEAMNVKDRELLKGKLKVPMFRTLYLDKLLEESEGVYSTRDSHFREVVKGFKTVKDADFEEPESLSRIMRNYQKDGYKWLRTLEAWKFGGILADDMGLGKTLQMIAVLLAAKNEGKRGTSLIVCPSSLVYNWGAEFEKFAPELKVSIVTGNQEERQTQLNGWKESDVLVTSYDLLKRDIALYEEMEFLYEII